MWFARVRTWTLACACAYAASASLLGCKDGTDYLEVRERLRDGGGDDTDAAAANGGRDGGGGKSGANGGGGNAEASSSGRGGDASIFDLDASLMLPDGSVILDDGGILLPGGEVIDRETAIDRYGPEVDVSTCEISNEDTWDTQVDIGDEGGFALVPDLRPGFGLAYNAIGSGTCRQRIEAMAIPSIGEFPEPHSVSPDCKALVDVSLLSVDDGWLLAFVDNFTDTAELHTIALDRDMNIAKGEMRNTLTNNTQRFERRPVLREVGGEPMVAWITENTEEGADSGKKSISTQRVDGEAEAIEVVGAGAGQHPEALAFSAIGDDAAAVGWVGPIESPGVWLNKLDADGAPVDAPIQLTAKVAASSSIDLAHRDDGGGAVYSIEIDGIPQVRFRRLDAHGEPVGPERTLIGPPLRAQSASLHALGGGYAVAYRALPGGDVEQPEVRLTFITKEGNLMKDPSGRLLSFHIGDATVADARTYTALSVDGELMIAWIDGDPSGKNALKVVRRRLDCN
jgi:hypothetical protein